MINSSNYDCFDKDKNYIQFYCFAIQMNKNCITMERFGKVRGLSQPDGTTYNMVFPIKLKSQFKLKTKIKAKKVTKKNIK